MKAIEQRGRIKIFWSAKYKTYYLQIPKSGCTTIKHQLGCGVRDWQTIDEPINPNYPILIGVREPLARLMSGFWEMKRMNHIPETMDFIEFVEMLNDKGLIHDHLWTQTYYIETTIYSFPLDHNYEFFIWNGDLTEKLRGVLNDESLEDIRLNATENSRVWMDSKTMATIRDLYRDDFRLYDKVYAETTEKNEL